MTYLPVDAEGKVKLSALQEALCEETILVSIMYVNNEMGAVQPIEEAARIIKGTTIKFYFMWMQFKDLENIEFIQSGSGLI